MQYQSHFLLDDGSQLGSARRAAMELAATLTFDEEQTGKVGLAVTECGTNVLKHAGSGRLMLRQLHGAGRGGIEIIALDKGPGITDVAASLRDGHSTAGSIGGGLGALSRISPQFEIFTLPGRGTAIRLELWPAGVVPAVAPIEYGGVTSPYPGESVCGDGWRVELWRDQAIALIADGLGHGLHAHEAAAAATDTLEGRFAADPQVNPYDVAMACHTALARTRGAAIGVGRLLATDERGSFAGIGNIVSRVEGTSTNRHLVSYAGIAGHTLRKLQEFAFPWPTGALLVLHSDGLGTHWDFKDYPGLLARHPALIAAVLFRDYDRGRDDTSVVVLRNRGAATDRS
jgi:anti-sigma regulatory factor (Ser/Thr protein kinase)